jgi:hypothetical protein
MENPMNEVIKDILSLPATGVNNCQPRRMRITASRRRAASAANSSTALGCIVSEAVSKQLLTVRSAAKRVGMSPAQLSRVMRGLYGVRSVHLANLIVGLNLSADYVMGAIYAENQRVRDVV